jgi:enhancing lycopene biosynthesis protein 2
MGAKHINTNVDDIIYDNDNKIASTAAYMLGPAISDIAVGIEKLVQKIVEVA